VKVLSITAGAGGMYCGSCLRDNALAAELIARGHDVTLLPLYTPLLTDEANVTRPEVLFGGISVYLQQRSSLFRKLPRFLERLIDSPSVISAFADRSVSVNPRLLGALTVSMLEGDRGSLAKEFQKLLDWTAGEPKPDVINITNSMLIGLARPLASAFGRPICCTLQGEDLFLESLGEPYKSRSLSLLRQQVPHVDRFIAVSDYYARFMSGYLQIPMGQISVVPLGINAESFEPRQASSVGPDDGVFRVGYFARVAPEKGLLQLAEAYQEFRRQAPEAKARLEAAGYLAGEHKSYLARVQKLLEGSGLAAEFSYRGTVDRAAKAAFLKTVDVVSVPATYDEPKGFSILEAMASGVPVIQPRRGTFTETLERTGGGLLVSPDSRDSLADALLRLWRDPASRLELGRKGAEGVRAFYTVKRSADRLLEVYEQLTAEGYAPLATKAAS
jgi:glycosyltransferase involved in cell wall biosynthesis